MTRRPSAAIAAAKANAGKSAAERSWPSRQPLSSMVNASHAAASSSAG